MDRNEAIEIPFGAFDSELKGWEYTIPEGMKARIEGNKIILEPKESEDESIRKEMLEYCYKRMNNEFSSITIYQVKRWLAWLEKQGSQNLANSAKTCKNGQTTAWSEEDERKFRDVIRLIEQGAPVQSMRDHYTEWFKALKDRVQPQNK